MNKKIKKIKKEISLKSISTLRNYFEHIIEWYSTNEIADKSNLYKHKNKRNFINILILLILISIK